MNNESLKKLLVVLGASLVIFWVFKPKKDGKDILSSFGKKQKRPIIKKPFIDDNDMQNSDLRLAYEALSAYIDAYNTDVSDEELQAIKDEFKDQMGLVIYTDDLGLLAVKDTNGYDVLVNS